MYHPATFLARRSYLRKRTWERSEPSSGEEEERVDKMLLRNAAVTFLSASPPPSSPQLTRAHRVSGTSSARVQILIFLSLLTQSHLIALGFEQFYKNVLSTNG